ncbi:inner membrane-spanning protein YciB [Parvularcula dongshanensis]|uniref:Inner membrane-spanning protein YciB n=1 Tax=Parvularcula dongshanensis TaxID=1173995 RepID=A0A840I1C9_9PROT|nr:inner membrane-spanning protein YciB [Parvularcula dongshanensis]MBB4658083.1 intracellular septation protein [Parvularcula dongshanensis]
MTEEITSAEPPVPGGARKLSGGEKMAVELGPLAFFLAGYFLNDRLAPRADELLGRTFFSGPGNELYLGLALFMPAFAVAFAWSAVRARRVAPMLLITGGIVTVLGVLTFVLHDKTFFYMKPTLVYGATAVALAGGLLTGRNFLRLLFDGAFELPEAAWRTLTWRFVGFNVLAALANEVLWRTLTSGCVEGAECAGEATWVKIKIFGFTAAYFLFVALNAPFLMRHVEAEK